MSIGGSERDDLEPAVDRDRWHVRCVRCRGYRMTVHADDLPAPGECVVCRARDPRRYWTRDWENTNGQAH